MDASGIIKQWPSTQIKQQIVLRYLASHIPPKTNFTEKEFHDFLEKWHSFGNASLLKRELYVKHHVDKELDGSYYWKSAAH